MNKDQVSDDIKELLIVLGMIMVFWFVKKKVHICELHTEVFTGEMIQLEFAFSFSSKKSG